MGIKELIRSLLTEGKSKDDILVVISEKFPEATAEDVLSAIKTVQKSIEFVSNAKKIEEKQIENEKVEERAKAIAEEQVQKALSAIPNPNDPLSGSKGVVKKHEFKSFVGDVIVTKDTEWHQKLKRLLIADRTKNFEEAFRISSEFIGKSFLFSDSEKKDYAEKLLRGDAVTGSYAVPDEFSDMVFVIAQAASAIAQGATKISMSNDLMYLLGSGDVSFTEVANQNTDLSNSEPTLTQSSMNLIDAGAFSYIHDNLIADSNVNIIQLLAGAYGRGLAKYQKRATTVGNIASSGDLINGIYSTSGIGSVAVADPNGSISYEDIVDLEGAIDDSFLDGAVFEMNRREFSKIRKIKDDMGRPILTTPDAGFRKWELLGYPVRINNQMPITLNATNGNRTSGATATILFGDPAQVQHGYKGGFMLESSIHYKFISRQTTFRGFVRWAQAIVNASAYARLTGIK